MRQKALELAQLGFRVFRLQPNGKLPIEKNFPAVATADETAVKAMWSDPFGEPTDHNIGIAMGKGLVAVDYDTKDGRPGLQARDKFDESGMPRSIRMSTPSGGEHLVLQTPPELIIGSSVQKIAPGVDTRGRNGYIVGPGSIIDGKSYGWIRRLPASEAAPVPDWFMPELLRHSRYADSPKETQPLCDLDEPRAIERAANWLVNEAPEAKEGEGGDQATFAVAARLRDFGVSEDMALDLLLEHWNEQKALPPWDSSELKRKVANAYTYGQNAPGAISALADFEDHEIDESMAWHLTNRLPNDPDWPRPTLLTPFDPEDIPAREFVLDGLFAKRTVSAIVAPSGAGKTQWLVQLALALAANARSPIGIAPARRMRTWLWNQEDDMDELHRRTAAAMLHFGIGWRDIGDRINMNSGVEKPLHLAVKDRSGNLRVSAAVPTIIERLKQNRTDVWIADPLVEFHQGEENDNVQMAFVAGILRRIAVEANVAVLIGHHDRKPDTASSQGHAGNQHAMRGASALQGVTRAIATLYTMSKEDAKGLGVEDADRHRFLRFDGAKNNLSLAGGRAHWFKRVGHRLSIDGDEIGVLEPSDIGDRHVGFEADPWTVILKALEAVGAAAGEWKTWQSIREVLTDRSRWLNHEYRAERTWETWMAEQREGTCRIENETLELVKKHRKTLLRRIQK